MNPFSDSFILRDPETTPPVNVDSYHAEILATLSERIRARANDMQASLVVAQLPGMGKTHLLWRLIQKHKESHISVFIPPINLNGDLSRGVLERVMKRLWESRDADGKPVNEFEVLARRCLIEGEPAWADFDLASFTQAHLQSHYAEKKDAFVTFMESHLSSKCRLNASPRDWATALLDILYSTEVEAYARSWMLGRYRDYDPKQSDELDNENELPIQRLQDLSQIFSLYKPILLLFDQIDNYLLWGDTNVRNFFVLVESLLRLCPNSHLVLSTNAEDWEAMRNLVKQKFVTDRVKAPLLLRGLNFQQAVELRNLWAGDQITEAKQKISDPTISKMLGADDRGIPTKDITPRSFLRECAALWDGKLIIGPIPREASVDLELEYTKTLAAVEREGIGFLESPLRTFFTEILGGNEVIKRPHTFYQVGDRLYFFEQGGNHTRWGNFAKKAEKLSPDISKICGIKRAQDLSDHERLKHWTVPSPGWRADQPWKVLLLKGARTLEIGVELMKQIQGATRLLDSANDLHMTRPEIAAFLRPRFQKIFPTVSSQDDSKIVPPQGENGVQLPSPAKWIVSTTVTDLASTLMRGGSLPTPGATIPMDRRGSIFHELANRFVRHLVLNGSYAADMKVELIRFLKQDGLWETVQPHDLETPKIGDALGEMSENIGRLRASASFAKSWSDLFPQPHGEENVHETIAEHVGIKVLVSGRVDLIRRVGADGEMEIVDYKLTGSPERLPVMGQAQLALYSELLRKRDNKPHRAVLEIYSPKLKSYHFTAEQIAGYFQKDLLPELRKKLDQAKSSAPSLAAIELSVRPVSELENSQVTEAPALPETTLPDNIQMAFEGYVGNKAVVHQLKTALAHSLTKAEEVTLPLNIMLSGGGGLGKSELARRIARSLNLPLVEMPGSALKSVDILLERVDSQLKTVGKGAVENGVDSGLPRFDYPSLVVFIDEVHELGRNADKFLNFFEPRERRAVGSEKVGLFPSATLIVATTDKGLLPKPFLTRFINYPLMPYSVDEVAEILRKNHAPGDDAFLRRLAIMSRLNPRIAKQRVEQFIGYHEQHGYPATEDGLKKMELLWGVDANGLEARDLKYLEIIKDRPVGLTTICNLLGLSSEEVQRDIEPFLIQSNLIRLTSHGREIIKQA